MEQLITDYGKACASTARTPPNSPARREAITKEQAAWDRVAAAARLAGEQQAALATWTPAADLVQRLTNDGTMPTSALGLPRGQALVQHLHIMELAAEGLRASVTALTERVTELTATRDNLAAILGVPGATDKTIADAALALAAERGTAGPPPERKAAVFGVTYIAAPAKGRGYSACGGCAFDGDATGCGAAPNCFGESDSFVWVRVQGGPMTEGSAT